MKRKRPAKSHQQLDPEPEHTWQPVYTEHKCKQFVQYTADFARHKAGLRVKWLKPCCRKTTTIYIMAHPRRFAECYDSEVLDQPIVKEQIYELKEEFKNNLHGKLTAITATAGLCSTAFYSLYNYYLATCDADKL